MHAEFVIKQCLQGSGAELVITGEVKKGQISEGSCGTTSRGKRFFIIKMESKNARKRIVDENERAALYVKNITLSDVRAGEMLVFK